MVVLGNENDANEKIIIAGAVVNRSIGGGGVRIGGVYASRSRECVQRVRRVVGSPSQVSVREGRARARFTGNWF